MGIGNWMKLEHCSNCLPVFVQIESFRIGGAYGFIELFFGVEYLHFGQIQSYLLNQRVHGKERRGAFTMSLCLQETTSCPAGGLQTQTGANFSLST